MVQRFKATVVSYHFLGHYPKVYAAPIRDTMLKSDDGDLQPGPALVNFMAGACVVRTKVFRELGGYDARQV